MIFTDIIAQNGYIGQYIRFVYYFSPMYNVSTWFVIRIDRKIYVPWASGPLNYILQYIYFFIILHSYLELICLSLTNWKLHNQYCQCHSMSELMWQKETWMMCEPWPHCSYLDISIPPKFSEKKWWFCSFDLAQ